MLHFNSQLLAFLNRAVVANEIAKTLERLAEPGEKPTDSLLRFYKAYINAEGFSLECIFGTPYVVVLVIQDFEEIWVDFSLWVSDIDYLNRVTMVVIDTCNTLKKYYPDAYLAREIGL